MPPGRCTHHGLIGATVAEPDGTYRCPFPLRRTIAGQAEDGRCGELLNVDPVEVLGLTKIVGSDEMLIAQPYDSAANPLGDLQSLINDLEFVADACDELQTRVPTMTSRRALWEAAVIAYGRCFSSGGSAVVAKQSRTRIPDELLATLSEADQACHRDIVQLRNQHIGHRVDLRMHKVVVFVTLSPPSEEREVKGCGSVVLLNEGGPERAKVLARTARALADRLKAQSTLLSQEVMRQARDSIDECYRAAVPAKELRLAVDDLGIPGAV